MKSLLMFTAGADTLQQFVMPVGRYPQPHHMLLAVTTSRLTRTVIVAGSLYLQNIR